jgi:ribosomal protein S18 acetylase RimI-like enzyme
VTGQNECALKLYRRLGFRRVKTLYKSVPTAGFIGTIPEASGQH